MAPGDSSISWCLRIMPCRCYLWDVDGWSSFCGAQSLDSESTLVTVAMESARNNEPPAFLAVSLKQLAAGWVRLFEDKFTEDDFIKFICGKSSLSILMQTLWASIEISETASEQMKNHEVFTGKANRRRSSLSTPPRQRVAVTVADSPTQSAGCISTIVSWVFLASVANTCPGLSMPDACFPNQS